MPVKQNLLKFILILVTAFFVFGYIIYPLTQLIAVSYNWLGLYTILGQKQIVKACFNSLLLSIVSVAGSAFIGTYFACTFHFKKIWLGSLFNILILLPIAIPPIVGVMAYLYLLGDNGLLMKILGQKFNFTGWTAIIIIHLYSFYPLCYLFIKNALKTIDNSIIEASYILGATKLKTFFKVILPQLKSALIGCSMLVFMASMASFSAPFIFGGSQRFLSTEIYYSKINGNIPLSALLSLLLTSISIIGLLFFKFIGNPLTVIKTKGAIKTSLINVNAPLNYLSSFITLIFCLLVLLPIVSLLVISLIPDNAMMQSSLNLRLSFNNYSSIFGDHSFLRPFLNSVKTSFTAVILTVALGLSVANIIRGKPTIFKTILEIISSIPYGIPGTVIAICLILSFNQGTIFSFGKILVGSFWILPVAYAIRNLPIITQAIKSGLFSIDNSIEEAAITLGAGNFKIWYSITLPLVYSFIIEGSLLVFINCFGEFVATVLLYNYGNKTLPIEIYAQLRLFNNGMAATYGIVLIIIVAIIIYTVNRAVSKHFAKF